MSSKHALYFLTAIAAAALLLFTLLANADDASAQQAVDNTPTLTSVPVATTFRSISAGGNISCGLRADGATVCWGVSLATDDEFFVEPPSDEAFASISVGWGNGRNHICGLRADGVAVCWGHNGYGQASPPTGETFTSITLGRSHTCGLRSDGVAVCWGGHNQPSPPANATFTSISAGADHTCGIRSDGAAACWGNGYVVTPPTGETFTSIALGRSHTCGLRSDGAAVCWGYSTNHYGEYSPPANETFTSISAGYSHTCGLRRDGSVACWGYDEDGQASPPSGAFSSINAGQWHTCGLRRDGSAVCWGNNSGGQLTPPTATPTSIPTHTPTSIPDEPTHTPTATSVSATDEPTPTPTSTSGTDEPTPTPTSTTVTDAPAPTLTPTATGVSTPVGDGISEFEEQVGALRDRAGTLQDMGTLNRLIESLRGLINALTDRVAELEGISPAATPTHTPTATNTPVTVLETTPTPTATSTSIRTATATLTPTATSVSALAPGCIRSISLGWLTGTWNADCQSTKTPPTAKEGTRYARYYAFTLDAPSRITVTVSSTEVRDTYLYLLRGSGNEGEIVNRGTSEIVEQLYTGTYTIEATTYNLETAGAFTLTMDISTTGVSAAAGAPR